MKKILPLIALLLVCVLSAGAQQRKTWNFRNGVSDETISNLDADANWTVTKKDDGTFNQAVDAAKMSGELTANGTVIEELRGLKFGSGGLKSNNNYIIGSNKFRFSRASESVILRVVPGQTITIKARSANTTAANRGFTGDDNMEYVSGPSGGICLGANVAVEDRDENGDYTLEWKVKEGIETTLEGDSIDVTIKVAGGGLDVSLIQIDEGDVPEEEAVNVAYLYDSSYPGYNVDADIPYAILSSVTAYNIDNCNIVTIDVAGDVSSITREALESYNVVVVSSAINKENSFVNSIKEAIAYTPMLVLTPNLYETWGYGKVVPTQAASLDVAEADRTNALFQPLDELTSPFIGDDGKLKLFEEGGSDAVIGYTADEGTYFAKDDVLATADGVNAIHIHNARRNAYMMLPYAFEMQAPNENISDIITNAVVILNKTKREVTKAAKPVISQTYRNQYTIVSLASSTAGSQFYYTLDGSNPTTESTLYTEPFEVHDANVTVKAVATANGYNLSDMQETAIGIYSVSAAPAISLAKESGKTTITLTSENENDVIYYNFRGSNDTLQCSRYSEPVEVVKHVTITAFAGQFAEDGTFLPSEAVEELVDVQDEKVRLDVIGHFTGSSADWSTLKTTAYNFYTEEFIGSKEVTSDDGEESVVKVYKPADVLTLMDPGNGWEFKTYGQVGQFQNNQITHNVLNFDAYNPQTAWDDSEDEATNHCVQFGGRGSNIDGETDPASACIQSTTLYQGPFDVVTYASGFKATGKVYVSSDTTDVNSWVEIGDVYGGTIKGTASNGKDGSSRIWRKTIASYEGTDLVSVKVASASGTLNLFDIIVKNAGEKSAEYTGIKDVATGNEAAGEVVRTMIYSINGTQLGKAAKGINIIKEVYANGTVKTRKVMVK